MDKVIDMSQTKPKQQSTKSQHYVPRFYLRNFANENEQIYVLNPKTQKVFLTSISKVCCQNWLYETEWKHSVPLLGKRVQENQIEHALSQKETTYALLLRSVLSKCQNANENTLICSKNEKQMLREFAANLLLRNPNYLQSIVDWYCEDSWKDNKEIRSYLECLETLQLGDPESVYRHAVKQATLLENTPGGPVHFHIAELEKMNFCFLKSNQGLFVTSSRPFVELTIGERNKVIGAFLPLSSKVALWFFTEKDLYPCRNRVRVINDEIAFFFNRLHFRTDLQETQYILSKSKNSINSLMLENQL